MRTTDLGFTTTKNHHWSRPWQHSTIADLGYNNTAHLSSWWTQHTRHPNRLTTLTDSTAPIERAIFGFSRKPKNLVAPNLKARLLQETQKLKNSKNSVSPGFGFSRKAKNLAAPNQSTTQTLSGIYSLVLSLDLYLPLSHVLNLTCPLSLLIGLG